MLVFSRTLKNGLKVFLAPMNGTKTITGVFIVRAGWNYETPGTNEGVAHFLEHMGFKGTTRHPSADEISSAIDLVGGNTNAGTNQDTIVYHIKAPARRAEFICDLLSDIVLNPLFKPEEIEREKGAVKRETAKYLSDHTANLVAIVLPQLMFGSHPAGWLGTGTEEQIEKINRSILHSYMEDLFVGPNAAVCFAGEIPCPQTFFEMIDGYFSPLPSRLPRKQKPPFIDMQKQPKVKFCRKSTEETLLAMGIKFPSAPYIHGRVLAVLNATLGDGMSSRLFRQVRERKGLAYDISSWIDFQTDTSILHVFGGFDPDSWQEGLAIIVEQLRLLRDGKIEEDEISRSREMLLGRREMALERSEHIAQGIANIWAINGPTEDFYSISDKISAVTLRDVQRAAKDILRDNRICLAVMGPNSADKAQIKNMLYI